MRHRLTVLSALQRPDQASLTAAGFDVVVGSPEPSHLRDLAGLVLVTPRDLIRIKDDPLHPLRPVHRAGRCGLICLIHPQDDASDVASFKPDHIWVGPLDPVVTQLYRDNLEHTAQRSSGLDVNAGATWQWHLKTHEFVLSRAVSRLLNGANAQASVSLRRWLSRVPPNDRLALVAAIRQVRATGQSISLRHRLVLPDGGKLIVLHRLELEGGPDGIVAGYLELAGPTSMREDVEGPLGLADPQQVESHLEAMVSQMPFTQDRSASGMMVLVLNVDKFSRIIATHGSGTLQRIREAISHRLCEQIQQVSAPGRVFVRHESRMGQSPLLGRLKDDEYLIAVPGMTRRQDMAQFARDLLVGFGKPIAADNRPIFLTASIGIAKAPDHGTCAADLIRAAQLAVIAAKGRATSSYDFYAPSLATSTWDRMELEHQLRAALIAGEMEMVYQPQVDIVSRRIVGVEALLRWNHPQKGTISPDSFLDVAAAAGITEELGQWALTTCLTEIRRMEESGLPRLEVSVNVSADMLTGLDLPALVQRVLAETGMPGRQLKLELTESMVMDNPARALKSINRLKDLGVRLALDDFGTGYSSLSYLKSFPFDDLKVDRSFIDGLGEGLADLAFLRAIISMAKTLDMVVTAEGVETPRQLLRLIEEGCDRYQGYLCSRPISATELMEWLPQASVVVN